LPFGFCHCQKSFDPGREPAGGGQSRRVGVGQGDDLAAAQASVTTRTLVEAVGEGEGVWLPGQQRQAVTNGAHQDR
jgi:hypothetical protein